MLRMLLCAASLFLLRLPAVRQKEGNLRGPLPKLGHLVLQQIWHHFTRLNVPIVGNWEVNFWLARDPEPLGTSRRVYSVIVEMSTENDCIIGDRRCAPHRFSKQQGWMDSPPRKKADLV